MVNMGSASRPSYPEALRSDTAPATLVMKEIKRATPHAVRPIVLLHTKSLLTVTVHAVSTIY